MLKNNQLLADTMRKAAAIRRKSRRSSETNSNGNKNNHVNGNHNNNSSSNNNDTEKNKPKPTQDELALTAKNYRLAKELSDLRVRHREECKNVTRLTMENMNLASRCREAIGLVAALKKELVSIQRQRAIDVYQSKQNQQRQTDVALISQSSSTQVIRSGSSGTAATIETVHSVLTDESPRQSPETVTDKKEQSIPAALSDTTTASTNSSPRQKPSINEAVQSDEIMSLPVAGGTDIFKRSVATTMQEVDQIPLLKATLLPSTNYDQPAILKATLVCSDDYDECATDYEDDDAFVCNDTIDELMINGIESKENWDTSSKKSRDEDKTEPYFPPSASPKLCRNYNEEFPGDITSVRKTHSSRKSRVDLDDDPEDSDDSSACAPVHLAPFDRLDHNEDQSTMSSIDAFEASFNTDFPESFSPRDGNHLVKSKAELYNPFLSSPRKSRSMVLPTLSLRSQWTCSRTSADPPGKDKTSPRERENTRRASPVSISQVMSKLSSSFGHSSPCIPKHTRKYIASIDDDSVERTRQELFPSSCSPPHGTGMHEYEYAPSTGDGCSLLLSAESYNVPVDEGFQPISLEKTLIPSVEACDPATRILSSPDSTGVVDEIPSTPTHDSSADMTTHSEDIFCTPPMVSQSPTTVGSELPKRPEKTGHDLARVRYEKAIQGRHGSSLPRHPSKCDASLMTPRSEAEGRPSGSTRSLTRSFSGDDKYFHSNHPMDEIARTKSALHAMTIMDGAHKKALIQKFSLSDSLKTRSRGAVESILCTKILSDKAKPWRDSSRYADPDLDDGDIPLRSNLSKSDEAVLLKTDKFSSNENSGDRKARRHHTPVKVRLLPWERKSSDDDIGMSRVRHDDSHSGDASDRKILASSKQLSQLSNNTVGQFNSASFDALFSDKKSPSNIHQNASLREFTSNALGE